MELKNIFEKINYFLLRKSQEKQFVPTKDEVDNHRIKSLSRRLKADSPKETLTNILEWQDRNLKFWEERWLTFGILMSILIISSLTLFFYFQGINQSLAVLLFIGFIIIAFIGKNILNFIFNLIFLFVFILTYVLLISTLIKTVSLSSGTFLFIIVISLLLGAFISIIINLVMKYKNIKIAIPEFNIHDTFKLSLPIEKILDYRLSICRDYAKLTSALLLNICPKAEIFFVLIPKHVAVALKLEDKIYVLDQKLPILTLTSWTEKWKDKLKKNKLKLEFIKIFRDNTEIKTKWLKNQEYQNDSNSQKEEKSNLNKITEELKRVLGVSKKSMSKSPCFDVEIPLRKGASLIESEDAIVQFSIIEALKNKIEDEIVGKISSICGLELIKKDKDLIIKISLKENETTN